MATNQSTIDFILDQLPTVPDMSYRKMFGEYALYCRSKVVAFVCDNQLFLKPSDNSYQFADDCELAPAYPGSKDYYLVPEEKIEDRDWLAHAILVTAEAVPAPKPKKPKGKRNN